MNNRAVIFANGILADPEAIRRILLPNDLLIAADGGTHHIRQLDLKPTLIIGDLDSLTEEEHDWALASGVQLIKYQKDKNETDLELAIEFAIRQGYLSILVVAALGGRLDQTLANLFLMSNPDHHKLEILLDDGLEEVLSVRTSCQIRGLPGDLVSLIPWGKEVTGIHTKGLRWILDGETLYPEKTRGISNEMTEENVQISISSGLLLVVHRRVSQQKAYT